MCARSCVCVCVYIYEDDGSWKAYPLPCTSQSFPTSFLIPLDKESEYLSVLPVTVNILLTLF
jgi:hypothetical protein